LNREFLMLAKVYSNQRIGGWYASEKLDGMRAFWDGGATRGMPKVDVPWANLAKDERLVAPEVCTGLWSRYGNVIHAPDDWLDKMPVNVLMDGELYLGPGKFQETMSIVKRLNPSSNDWESVAFKCFDLPAPQVVFQRGRINNPQFKEKQIDEEACLKLFKQKYTRLLKTPDVISRLSKEFNSFYHPQTQISHHDPQGHVFDLMMKVLEKGGEGLVLREPDLFWIPKRNDSLLKVKPSEDSEAIVTGYVWGKGKYENMLGCLIVKWRDKVFELSGFTDAERTLKGVFPAKAGEVATDVISDYFPIGTKVTFKYRELSNDGIPKEARYYRKYQ